MTKFARVRGDRPYSASIRLCPVIFPRIRGDRPAQTFSAVFHSPVLPSLRDRPVALRKPFSIVRVPFCARG